MKTIFKVVFLFSVLMVLSGCDLFPTVEEEVYIVSFNSNEGTNVADISVSEGKSFLEPTAPTRERYSFAGWYSDSLLNNYYDFTQGVTGDVILYAKWEQNQYSVSYINYDDTVLQVEWYDLDEDLSGALVPSDPEREGYIFVEWNDELPSTMPNHDISINAIYEVEQYTFTLFDEEGIVLESKILSYGESLDLVEPVIDGYIFVGWYADIDLINEYIPSTMPDYDLNVYVKLRVETHLDLINVLDELPEEDITISFWHVYGS